MKKITKITKEHLVEMYNQNIPIYLYFKSLLGVTCEPLINDNMFLELTILIEEEEECHFYKLNRFEIGESIVLKPIDGTFTENKTIEKSLFDKKENVTYTYTLDTLLGNDDYVLSLNTLKETTMLIKQIENDKQKGRINTENNKIKEILKINEYE